MKIKLYKCFEHWYHGGTIWLYSDPHFQKDKEMEQYFNWPSSEQRLEYINKLVTKNDTFICLGDVGDDLQYISRIKCDYKVLVTGNHDKGNSIYKRKVLDCGVCNTEEEAKAICKSGLMHTYSIGNVKPDGYISVGGPDDERFILRKDNRLFDEIYDGPLFINQKILLSHESIKLPFVINIHGHHHTQPFITCKSDIEYEFGLLKASDLWCKEFTGHNFCINCAADVIRFKPIRLDKLLEYVPQKSVKSIHEFCIDEATERKKNVKTDCV